MKTAALIMATLFFQGPPTKGGDGPPDMRVELPRDLRLMLLGVPSTQAARAAQTGLQEAVREYAAATAGERAVAANIQQATARLYFRLGKFDQAVASLVSQMRDQERIKGLEAYRTLGRELAVRAESLSRLSGDSAAPVIDEEEAPNATAPGELALEVKASITSIDETLTKIEQASKADAERKAQLDRDMGTIGQFVLHLRGTVEQIRDVSAKGAGEVQIETDRFVQDVQSIIDLIRERKRERQLRDRTDGR
jgi:hypothetical protein